MTMRDKPVRERFRGAQIRLRLLAVAGAHGHLVDAAVELVEGEGAVDWIHGVSLMVRRSLLRCTIPI